MRAFPLTFLSRQFGAWAVIALGAVTARVLGPESRGAVEALVVLRLGLHAFACLGLPTSATYAVARDPSSAPAVSAAALGLGLRTGLLAALGLAAFAIAVPHVFTPIPVAAVVLFAASAPLIVSTQNLAGVLLGAGASGAWNALTFVNRGVMVAGLALLFVPALASVTTVVVVLVVAELAAFGVALRAVRRIAPLSVRIDRPILRALESYGLRAWMQGALSFALLRVDVLLLASMTGTRPSGLYAAAGLPREMVLFLPWVAGMLLLPKEAASRGSADGTRGLARWLPRGLDRRGWAIVLGAVVLLFVFAGPFTTGFHGERFRDAVPLARILVFAALLAGAGNLEVQELLGRGASGLAALASGAALCVSVAGNFVFVPRAGALATAWTALASAAVLLAVTTAAVGRIRRAGAEGASGKEGSGPAPGARASTSAPTSPPRAGP